jgi:ABC-2 type transport system permease protein
VKKVWLILVREYLENVRTKAFIVGIVLTPLWFGMVFVVPLLARGQEAETQRVVLVDETGLLATEIQQDLVDRRTTTGRALYEVEIRDAAGAWTAEGETASLVDRLRAQAAKGEVLAVLLTQPVLEKRAAAEEEHEGGILHAASAGVIQTAQVLRDVVNQTVNKRIMEERGIRPEDARLLQKNAIQAVSLSRTGEAGGEAQFVAPLVFMMFLFMGIVGISQMLVNSTIEEKGSRVYEVLLSSVSPFQLMAGKVLGICAVGFTLLALWTGGGIAAASMQGMDGLVTGQQVGLFVAYYVLGFLLIASLMVAVGSACNTLKEAQNLMAPLSMLLALPLLLSILVLKNPNGTFATITSFFPPFTPFLMMARVAAVPGPPTWQIWASLLLLVLATYLAIRLAARVFRVGILMYGKPPRLSEIWRWMFTDR